MNIKRLAALTAAVVCSLGVVGILNSPAAFAEHDDEGGDSTSSNTDTDTGANASNICGDKAPNCNKFVKNYINPIVVLLTTCVGIFAVISLIIAGIQYSSSADDPAAVTKAKQRIFSTIIGLLAYLFLFAFMSYLLPGGLGK
jgi:hypothetical protein